MFSYFNCGSHAELGSILFIAVLWAYVISEIFDFLFDKPSWEVGLAANEIVMNRYSMLADFFVFVGPLAWAPIISSKWVLVAGGGCYVLVLLWVESFLTSVLGEGSLFASGFFCVFGWSHL